MEITVKRHALPTATVGELFINGIHECFTLEDVDRGLTQDTPLSEIREKKVYGQTAIPKGRYEVVVNYSNNFKRMLPLLLRVPGFDGVRIHPGNGVKDTLGCILVGKTLAGDKIVGGTSRPAFDALFAKILFIVQSEKIWITIE